MPAAPRDSLTGLNGGPPAGRRLASSIIQHGPQKRPARVSTNPIRADVPVQRGADPFPEGDREATAATVVSCANPQIRHRPILRRVRSDSSRMRASSTTHGPQESQGSAATRTRLRRTQGAWRIDLIIMMVLVALTPGIGAATGPGTNSTPHDSKPHGLPQRTTWTPLPHDPFAQNSRSRTRCL